MRRKKEKRMSFPPGIKQGKVQETLPEYGAVVLRGSRHADAGKTRRQAQERGKDTMLLMKKLQTPMFLEWMITQVVVPVGWYFP